MVNSHKIMPKKPHLMPTSRPGTAFARRVRHRGGRSAGMLLAAIFLTALSDACSSPHRVVPLNIAKSASPGFTQMDPGAVGIQYGPPTITELDKIPVHVSNPGLAAGDVDGDGLCDLFICRLDGSSGLFRNLGDWRFENTTETSGLNLAGKSFFGATLADIDGDGDLDLLLLSLSMGSALYRNDGTGHFTEDNSMPWLKSEFAGDVSATLADIDGDGDLDLYITRYRQVLLKYKMPRVEYDAMIAKAMRGLQNGVKPNDEFLGHFFVFSEYDGKEVKYRIEEKGALDALYLNDGKGQFRLASNDPGRFRDEKGQPMPMPEDWGLAAMFRDIDNDGDPDLYVCNDFLSPDRFWINDGTGQFQLIDRLALRRTSWFSMGVDFADINRDGHLDFFVVDMLSRSHLRRKRQMGDMIPTPIVIGRVDDRPQFMQNTLFLNRGDGSYTEIAQLAGLKASEWSWCPMFLDIDLDGYEDVIVSNGMKHDMMDADADAEMLKLGNLDREQSVQIMNTIYPKLDTPNLIFRNKGDLTFEDKSREWGFRAGAISGGMVSADLDNDGDLDIVINNIEDYPLEIYRNDASAPRVAVRLRSESANTQGIGARLRLTGGPVEQTQEIIVGGAYSSSSEPMRTFAAGQSGGDMKLEVLWRDGRRTVIEDVKPDRLYVVSDTSALPYRPAPAPKVETVFEDRSDKLNHKHSEAPFDDFAAQPLLPNRLSQLGPGIAWFDVDRDGDDDLIVGSGRAGNIHVLVNDGKGGFEDHKSPQLHMEITGLLGFINHEGDVSLFAGMSDYESGQTEHPSAMGFYFKEGKRWHLQDGIDDFSSSTGPVSLGDIDGDGDLDLFVGGRVVPGKYPTPASSRVFLNDNGKWTLDAANQKALTDLGMVSSSVFGDIDGDGDADLVLALEWGPIKILRNDGGRLVDATAEFGLSSFKGWWNGIALGDLDNDGRLDIVASNWGRNTKYENAYSVLKPLQIYYGDLDDNGVTDVVEAHFDKYMNVLVPERGRSCSSRAIPLIGQRNASYTEFGGRSLHEVYGACLETARTVDANTLAHMVFLNRGKRYEGRELPIEAQFAPGFYVGVADYDGDGNEDIFMSQNFFAVQVETPRNDGGRSIWLKGDGSGNFKTVPAHVSGVAVYGEQRGAALADYDRDGRVDVVVSQNGAQTKLFRNRLGKPGLRVRLQGDAKNPSGIGAVIRLKHGDRMGPARLVTAGSGYWSQDSSAHVLALPERPASLEVRWPGGKTTTTPIPANAREVTVSQKGEALATN